jgi:hypothetical protein
VEAKTGKTHRSGLIAPAKGCSHGVAAAGWGVKAGRRTTRADIVDKVGVVDLRTGSASVKIRHAHPLGHGGQVNPTALNSKLILSAIVAGKKCYARTTVSFTVLLACPSGPQLVMI